MWYAIVIEQAEGNFSAYVPDLPGCITTGRTLEETDRNIREAIQGHLQTLREFGEPRFPIADAASRADAPAWVQPRVEARSTPPPR